MPSMGFEPVIPGIKCLQAYPLDHTATGMSISLISCSLCDNSVHRNRLKGKLTPLIGEIDTDWLTIKEAITKAEEESIGYKTWKNRKWLRTWNEEMQWAIEEKKASYKKYLQDKIVDYYIEYKRHRAIVRKMTRRQRRDDRQIC